ncbi:poly(ADP-ribose) glycohydrolase 1-like [Carex rostrata]
MSRDDAKAWFDEVIPNLASLLLRLPSLLEAHYHKSNELSGNDKCELRILGSQDAGILILNRELIAGLLACAFLCLFPTKDRDSKHLPMINFDQLFVTLVNGWRQSQHEKVKCFVHYFERICKDMPNGVVSFERKVLPSFPDAEFWKSSDTPLCPIKIFTSGSIEDQPHEALEVIFSNEKFGGNSLYMGCVQEHIRFMINPELVVGMLFMASMGDNEAVEVVGVERYAEYTGYGSSFRFSGEYMDKKPVDSMERRKTQIVAIDALNKPSREQFYSKSLLREVNKAFCGFNGSKYESNYVNSQKCQVPPVDGDTAITCNSISNEKEKGDDSQNGQGIGNRNENGSGNYTNENTNVGIATGNWGCGICGGDPQIKCIIQWIAASQSNRPFIHYYTFNEGSMKRSEQVIEYITNKKWNVGDLWKKLVDYTSRKLDEKTTLDLFSWIQSGNSNTNGHKGHNSMLGSKRNPDPIQQDDRPNRVKRKPVWLKDYVIR